MKTSKILLSALVGVMTVGGAGALTTDEIKARCNSSKDTVWDSFNNTCVPRNPCKKDGYAAYCNKEFAEVQAKNTTDGEALAVLYAHFTDGQRASCIPLEEPGIVGQDYVGCTYDNGHYVVFEFDDLSESGDIDLTLPAKFTEIENGNSGCYGYPHGGGNGNWRYAGQWINNNPILPDNVCFVSSYDTDGLTHKFCMTANDGKNGLTVKDTAYSIQLIMLAKYNHRNTEMFNWIEEEVSPDGTNVYCLYWGI